MKKTKEFSGLTVDETITVDETNNKVYIYNYIDQSPEPNNSLTFKFTIDGLSKSLENKIYYFDFQLKSFDENNFREDNKYYIKLAKYGVNLEKARIALDRDIIHYDNSVLDYKYNDESKRDLEVNMFLKNYRESKKYFMKTMFNETFDMYENYFGLSIFLIKIQAIFLTIDEIYKDFTNINLFNEHQIDSMFISSGLPLFKDLPRDYRVVLLKNFNNIFKKRGTTNVFTEILNIFQGNIDDIGLVKYMIVKDWRRDKGFNYDLLPSYTSDELNELSEDTESIEEKIG